MAEQTDYDDKVAYLRDLTDFASSEAAQEVLAALPALRIKYRDDAILGVHVAALADIAPRLVEAIAMAMPTKPIAASAPLMPVEGSQSPDTTGQQPSS